MDIFCIIKPHNISKNYKRMKRKVSKKQLTQGKLHCKYEFTRNLKIKPIKSKSQNVPELLNYIM